MTISPIMNSGLNSLLDINNQMSDVQNRLSTGKKTNLSTATMLTVNNYNSRVSSLSSVNDGILTVLSELKSAQTASKTIQKNMTDLLSQLKDARTTQTAGTSSSSSQQNTATTQGAAFSLTFTSTTAGKLFTQSDLMTSLQVNGVGFKLGDQLQVEVDSSVVNSATAAKTITIQIASADAVALTSPEGLAAQKTLRDNASTALDTANNAVGSTSTAQSNAATALGNATLPAPTAGNKLNANVIAMIQSSLGLAATSTLTVKQYVDQLVAIKNGTVTLSAAALKAGGNLKDAAAAAALAKTAEGNIGSVSTAALTYDNAVNAYNTAVADQAAKQKTYTDLDGKYQQNLNNAQDGTAAHPWLVATAQDYINALGKLASDDANRMHFNETMTAGANYKSFTFHATTDGDLIIKDPSATATHNTQDLMKLFQNDTATTEPDDKTNPYDTQTWSAGANGAQQLRHIHYTGTGTSSTSTPADAKRAVAANAVRSFMDTMKQLVRDSRVNGVNVLNGEQVQAVVNTDGDLFKYQLTDSTGTAKDLPSMLNIDLTSLGLVATTTQDGQSTTKPTDFNGNTTLDAAITAFTAATAVMDTVTAGVSSATSTLQDRSDFNNQMKTLFAATASSLESSDSTADAAELASLQSRQQFANSILSIIKQGEQNPLQLLR